MGFLRKIKANFRLWEGRRIHERSSSSYDMTEIAESTSEGSIEYPKLERDAKVIIESHLVPKINALRSEHGKIHMKTSKCNSRTVPFKHLSEAAKSILLKAFPEMTFENELVDEDLLMYPDPEPSIYGSVSSEEDAEECRSHEFFRGLIIDTSDKGQIPSQADPSDEFLVHSPSDAIIVLPTCDAVSESTNLQQPYKIAHIFHQELSTLYEEHEGEEEESLTSIENCDANKEVCQLDLSKESCVHDRWSNLLRITMAGHCGQQGLILDEAEI